MKGAEIKKVLKALRARGISYVYLKNFEWLISGKPYKEKDADIIISKKALVKAKEVLKSQGYYPMPGDAVVNFHSIKSDIIFGVHVDGLYFLGSKFLTFEEISRNSIVKNGIRIPNDTYLFLIVMLNTVFNRLSKKKSIVFPQKYTLLMRKLWNSVDKRVISRKLSSYFSVNQSKSILDAAQI